MPGDRMFGVLVLGGIALVGASACGSTPDIQTGWGAPEMPSEPRVPAHPGVSSSSDAGDDAGLPSEILTDAAHDAGAADESSNDAAPEAGSDAADATTCPPYDLMSGDFCFPIEGPQ